MSVDTVVREPCRGPDLPSRWTTNCEFFRASPRVVRYFNGYWSKVEGESLPVRRVTHDGIEQIVAECCSVIHYRHGGRWWTITGMD